MSSMGGRFATALALLAALSALAAAPALAGPTDSYPVTGDALNQSWYWWDTSVLTIQSGEVGDCHGHRMANTAWARFVGTGGPVTVSTDNDFTTIDPVLEVWNASGGRPTTYIDCNDDVSTTDRNSRVTIDTVAGAEYLAHVGACYQCGPNNTTPTGQLRISLLGNDRRAYAETLAPTSSVTRTNLESGVDAGEVLSCSGQSYSATVWYKVVTDGPGPLRFTAPGLPWALPVYAGKSPAPAACSPAGFASNTNSISLPVGA